MSVRRSMFWSIIGNWINFGSNLISGMVLARLLAPNEFGVVAVAMAAIGIFGAVLQMGAAAVIVREPEIDDKVLGSALAIALIEGMAVAILIGSSSTLVANWQRSAEVGTMMLLLAPMPLFGAIENVLTAVWWRNLQFRSSATLVAAKSALQAVVAISLALAGLGPASLAWGMLAAATLGLLIAFIGLRSRHVRPNFQHFRRFLKFGGIWMLLGGLRALNARIPELLLGRLVGLSATGLYNRASASLDMVTRNGVEPIARVMLPLLSEDHRRGASMADGVIKLSGNITALFWPLLGFLALESPGVIAILFGDRWLAAAPVLSLLCLWCAMLLPTSGTGEVLLILDRLALSVRIETVRTMIGILLVIAAAPAGLVAVAAARVLEPVLFMPVYIAVLRRLAGMSVRRWAFAQLQSLIVFAITLSPLVLMRTVQQIHPPLLVDMAIKGTLTGITFVLALLLLRHPLANEGLQILRNRIGRGA